MEFVTLRWLVHCLGIDQALAQVEIGAGSIMRTGVVVLLEEGHES